MVGNGLKRGKVLVCSVVSESMEVEGISQHDISGMQGVLWIPLTVYNVGTIDCTE